jgi:50S ribosomal subunit-associated GTPase HflX
VIRVWNKADRVSPVRLSEHLEEEEGWAVSALDGSGCDVLLEQIESALFSSSKRYTPRPKQST